MNPMTVPLTIQRRLTLAFLGLAVVPLLLAALVNASLYYRQHADAQLKGMQEIALRVAAQVDGALRQGEHALGSLRRFNDLPRLTPKAQEALLSELLAQHALLQEAAVLDAQGRELARHSSVEAVLERRDRSADENFHRAAASDKAHYGAIHYDPSGEPLLPLALPQRDLYTGHIETILTAELRLKSLWNLVADLTPGPGAQVYVLDERGVVIAHRNPSVVLRGTRVTTPGRHAVTQGIGGNRVFMAISPVQLGDRGFRVVAEHEWLHAMTPAINSLLVLGGVLAVALSLAFGAGMHVLRYIVRPIMDVEKTARAIAAGDLTRRLAVSRRDEIGHLAESFNAMSDHLQRTLTELRDEVVVRQQAEAELLRHREQLEVLVAERTTALRESELRYRTVANFTNDWETWLGEDGQYRYVSPSCERITGYRAEEFMADPELLLRILHREDRERFKEHLVRNRDATRVETQEFRLLRRDGRTIWVEHICQPVHDERGRYLGTRASNRDVTEHKHLAIELARARDQAQGANRAKSTFLANMSHELRTPMNAILGFAQLLQQDASLSEEQLRHVATIARSGRHLLTLINDVLEISKIEAGKSALDLQSMDLIELIESIEDMVRLRAENKRLALVVTVDPQVPRNVRGDAKKLRQVLINLLGNAIKFTTHGGVSLRVDIEPGPRGRIRFEVADTGCGIAAEDREHIFEAFFQTAESSVSGEGTGLGLSISREYTELMGGRLTLESAPGKGSTFRFALPLKPINESELDRPKTGGRVVGLAPGQPRYRILIVEDRPDNRELLCQLLKSVGFEVRSAENGERALNVFHTWHPHLVWMDMRMPVMDGYEATRRIKASPQGHNTVVLALTASAFEEDRAAVLASGCDGFLRKPLEVDVIFAAMSEHLGVRYQYAEDLHPQPVGIDALLPDAQALASVPAALRKELGHAALLLDSKAAMQAIHLIRAQQPALADALARLVDDYRFDELVRLCNEPSEDAP